jgi:hypothetical protein
VSTFWHIGLVCVKCIALDHGGYCVLDVSAAQWTCATKVISAIDTQIVQIKIFNDIWSLIIHAFSKLSTSTEPEPDPTKLFAKKCKEYAANEEYKKECEDTYELKKSSISWNWA